MTFDQSDEVTWHDQKMTYLLPTYLPSCLPTYLPCDTNYNTDNWEPGLMTIFVAWQLIVTLDSIRNSCDVLKDGSPSYCQGHQKLQLCHFQNYYKFLFPGSLSIIQNVRVNKRQNRRNSFLSLTWSHQAGLQMVRLSSCLKLLCQKNITGNNPSRCVNISMRCKLRSNNQMSLLSHCAFQREP